MRYGLSHPNPRKTKLQKNLFYRLVIVNAEIKVSMLNFCCCPFWGFSPVYWPLFIKILSRLFSYFLLYFLFQPQNKHVPTRLGPGRIGGRGGAHIAFSWYSLGFLGQCCLLPLALGSAWSSVPGRTEIRTPQLVPWRCLLISPPTFLGSTHFSLFFTFLVQALSPRTDQRAS